MATLTLKARQMDHSVTQALMDDMDVSCGSKGIYKYLLPQPSDRNITTRFLAMVASTDEEHVFMMLNELIDRKYIKVISSEFIEDSLIPDIYTIDLNDFRD